jgi:hypothetical protein
VQTGENAFEHVHGMGLFEYLDEHLDTAAIFNQAMTSGSARSAVAIAQGYDWSGIKQLVDVGGGHGFLIAAVLQAYPTMQGILFDRPEVVSNARAMLDEQGLTDRCAIVAGNFFDAVPAGADAYVLRFIVHDWDDDRARTILEQCHRAMDTTGRVFLVERIVGTDYREALPALHGDMQMLVSLSGRERTEVEYRALLTDAGFRLTSVVPLADGFSVLEGTPA